MTQAASSVGVVAELGGAGTHEADRVCADAVGVDEYGAQLVGVEKLGVGEDFGCCGECGSAAEGVVRVEVVGHEVGRSHGVGGEQKRPVGAFRCGGADGPRRGVRSINVAAAVCRRAMSSRKATNNRSDSGSGFGRGPIR